MVNSFPYLVVPLQLEICTVTLVNSCSTEDQTSCLISLEQVHCLPGLSRSYHLCFNLIYILF